MQGKERDMVTILNVYVLPNYDIFMQWDPNRDITLWYSQNSISTAQFCKHHNVVPRFYPFYVYPNRGIMIVGITKQHDISYIIILWI